MMKRLKVVLAFLLAVCAVFALAACGPSSSSDDEYHSELTGTSVSPFPDSALSHEWQLYGEAQSDGYTGTFMEFLREIEYTVSDDTAAIHSALTSAVCIESVFGTGSSASYSLGAGVIYSLNKSKGDAYIVTNYHVVYGKNRSGKYGLANEIEVYLYGGYVSSRAVTATFYGGEMNYDIAVLKVSSSSVLRNSYAAAAKIEHEKVTTGERVYAIGNPNGEGFSVTGGVVSVPYETIDVMSADDTHLIELPEIRIDANINHGNSGGGLFNANGELVGIVNARGESEDFLGYAIPMETVSEVLARVMQ